MGFPAGTDVGGKFIMEYNNGIRHDKHETSAKLGN
jgi:hypothetical protein